MEDEIEYLNKEQFCQAYPDKCYTWELDEHPEFSDDVCACRSCRELSLEN